MHLTCRSSPPSSLHKTHLVPDDPRRPRRGRGGRAVLRLHLPAARHQPRRPPRVPRHVHRPRRASWWSSPCCGCTTASPLNTLKGRIPQWEVQEVVTDARQGEDRPAVRDIEHEARTVAEATEAANVKAAVDAALVTKVSTPTVEVHARTTTASPSSPTSPSTRSSRPGRSAAATRSSGRASSPTRTQYAVVQFCEVGRSPTRPAPFGLPPLPPECATGRREQGYVVLVRDLGSLRVPPFVAFVVFSDPLRPRPAAAALAREGRAGGRGGRGRAGRPAPAPERVRTGEGVTMHASDPSRSSARRCVAVGALVGARGARGRAAARRRRR